MPSRSFYLHRFRSSRKFCRPRGLATTKTIRVSLSEAMKHRSPICKKPTDSATDAEFPFCSERCQLHDLGNWATEKYTISEPALDYSLCEDETSGSDSRARSRTPAASPPPRRKKMNAKTDARPAADDGSPSQ